MPRRGVRILPAHQATRMTIFSTSEEKWVENDILHAKMYFNMRPLGHSSLARQG
jgi:hypothetical protein